MKYIYAVLALFYTTSINSQTPNWLWAQNSICAGDNYGRSVNSDLLGNIYVTGSFQDSISFGTVTLKNYGTWTFDIFIAKFNSLGNLVWAKSAGGNSGDEALSIAVDDSGNCYITGIFWSDTIYFGSEILINNGWGDIFIAKYDSSGDLIWVKGFGGAQSDYGNSIKIDNSGNIFVTGRFGSPIMSLDSMVLYNYGSWNTSDIFLAKVNSQGYVLWAISVGGYESDIGTNILIDNFNNVYVTGTYESSSITFDNNTINNSGGTDIFLVKYDSLGNDVWAISIGGDWGDYVGKTVLDAMGNLYLTGFYNSSGIYFGNNIAIQNSGLFGTYDIFVVKLDLNGNTIWALNCGGLSDENNPSFGIDSTGNIYLSGSFNSNFIDINGSSIVNSGGNFDIFIAKISSSGNPVWTSAIGGSNNEVCFDLIINGMDEGIITGYYDSPVFPLGGNSLISSGNLNFFLSRFGIFTGQEILSAKRLNIYPNPAAEFINISYDINRESKLEIYDTVGKIIKKQHIIGNKEINIADLTPGIYFIKIKSEEQEVVSKFVKQ